MSEVCVVVVLGMSCGTESSTCRIWCYLQLGSVRIELLGGGERYTCTGIGFVSFGLVRMFIDVLSKKKIETTIRAQLWHIN